MLCLELFGFMALTIVESTALSTPFQPSLNTTAGVAITPPYPPLSASLNTNLSETLTAHGTPICTNGRHWQLPGDAGLGIYASACYMALQALGTEEIISPMQRRFISATASGDFSLPIVRTPRKYIGHGKIQYQTVKADM